MVSGFWDVRAEVQANGDVILRGPGGVDRFFRRNGNGTFTAAPGYYGRPLAWRGPVLPAHYHGRAAQ